MPTQKTTEFKKKNRKKISYLTKKVAIQAVRQDWRALKHVSECMKADKQVVMEAIKSNWRSLEFASDSLKADRDVVNEAMYRMTTEVDEYDNGDTYWDFYANIKHFFARLLQDKVIVTV